MRKYYIGLSVTYHDPALAIIDQQGVVLYAEATERILQNKRALNCPPDALFDIEAILRRYCVSPDVIDIAINWKKNRPFYENVVAALGCLSAQGLDKQGLKRLRSPLENYKLHHMMACQRNSIAAAGLNLVRIIREIYPLCQLTFADFDHHLTHAATACYGSPFSEAACAVVDSFGENGSLAFYRYQQGELHRLYESRGTGSLGLFYMKITELCGFDWIKGEEWKVMGLAPYGKFNAEFYRLLAEIIEINGFACRHRGRNIFSHLDALEKFKVSTEGDEAQAADLAYTGQYFFSELMTKLLQHLQQRFRCENLVLTGGCALNSSFNGQIIKKTAFEQVHVPSAPADDGTALGAAWLSLRKNRPDLEIKPKLLSPYTGSEITSRALQRFIDFNRSFNIQNLAGQIYQTTAALLADGQLIGWIQGRAEFGPRALGNRSILADPRPAQSKDKINQRVKFRESFRPFAPAVLHEYAGEYFENYQLSPYMDKTQSIKPAQRQKIAAVCHVDGTGRVQTVKQEWNPRFYELIRQFNQLTEIPILLNTSFNVMGKPLVHSLEDAIAVLMTTGLDAIVIDETLISKNRRHDYS